ncbi:MAG: HsdM family class I SAM-dependent methyltransferase [Candidatus Hodarchaeales archaeon]
MQLFSDFSQFLSPVLEGHIYNQLRHRIFFQKRVHTVLHKMSWIEWLNKPELLTKQLSRVLIALLYDKVLITIKKLENTAEIDDILSKISFLTKSQKKGLIDTEEARDQFIEILEHLWLLASKSEPRTPILHHEDFPLNKLIDCIFCDWDSCLKTINLIQEIVKDNKSKKQLLLPNTYEMGIPEQQKQRQGQVFTPSRVVDFLCQQNVTEKTIRIIDPCCGTGLFLLGALSYITKFSHLNNQIKLIGIEKDPFLADIAESAINYFLLNNPTSLADWKIYRDDFFNCDRSSLELSSKDLKMTTILMNPPYTRHEILAANYKEFLKQKMDLDLQKIWQKETVNRNLLSGRSSLYAYFLIHATSLLREGDNFGIIIPNSWLDVDYGQQLQQFILDHYLIEYIVNCQLEKLIPNVDVNTAILKLKRRKTETIEGIDTINNLVEFISLKRPLDLDLLAGNNYLHGIQVVSMEQKELYSISKWGVFFRAPLDYFKVMKNLDEKLIKLDEIARVRRGFTSGANAFFYVGKPGQSNTYFKSSWDPDTGDLKLQLKDEVMFAQFKAQGFEINEPMFIIEKEYWMNRVDITREKYSWEYSLKDGNEMIWVPNYLVKSPRVLRSYEIKEKDLKYVVILISPQDSFDELQKGIKEYVRWGEEWTPSQGKKFNLRPTCQSRKNWYELPSKEYKFFNLLGLMTINDRFPFFYNPRDFYFDARLYGIQFFQNNYQQMDQLFSSYFLFLNSIITTLQLELLGRSNLGEGALDIKVYEYELLKIPSYEFLVEAQSKGVNHIFSQFLKQSPFSVIQEKPKLIKKNTNDFVSSLFSLSPALLDSLFNELKKLVQMRIEKAKS